MRKKSKHAWTQIYRALDHGSAYGACKQNKDLAKFPKGIEDFGNAFVELQGKRHSADYDPVARFTKSEVIADIERVEAVIAGFENESKKDRLAFCTFVLFKRRNK